ncbi:lantibiotic dehydratase [Priestia taiwanensis]|uniref:Uncharacterized protein n=1 Tax=Priestia taiwanensis TaxID=1347902 RepID=A0A917AKE1_9BACI|nr:lantibiotic dehydratase [Priestia taiwanensis]MBM7362039.1 thiopeptide-type bacteriocin biosynthesis protein [Priestia taiwanensis]GGE58978.1 hypothetical protein GCM10007140_06640 [Priestia taiwanensis]
MDKKDAICSMKINDTYFRRSPALDMGWIHTIYSHVDIDYLVEVCRADKSIMERILVASSSLYEALQKKEISKPTKHALIKYMLRMSARAMPFGLFAGITKMDFGHVSTGKEQKIVELSMEWLEKITQYIEQEQHITSNLLVIKNPSIQEIEDSYYMDVVTERKEKRSYLRKSAFTVELLRIVENPKTINFIIEHFSKESPGNEEAILTTIKQLLTNRWLISNVRPSSIKRETNMEYILGKKEFLSDDIYHELKDIDLLIQQYKESGIGEGIDLYQELIEKMKKICPSKSYVVVDLMLESCEEEVVKGKMEECIKNLHFLEGMNHLSLYNLIWDKYGLEFLNRYGLHNEVCIVDLVDLDVGIGVPKSEEYKHVFRGEVLETYHHFLLVRIQKSLLNGGETIELSDEDIEYIKKITKYHKSKKNKIGFDVKLSVIHENNDQKVVLAENSFGATPFSFTGRLNYPMDRKSSDVSIMPAEINVISNNYKDLGVTYVVPKAQINIHGFPNEEALNIPINDVFIGMDRSGFYLKSKTLQKKIHPTFTHKLSYNNFTEDASLLLLSQLESHLSQQPSDFLLGMAVDLPFIPRIEYKNIILSLKRWNLTKREMSEYLSDELTVGMYVKRFLLEYKVDTWVNILVRDMILPVRIDTELGIELIIEEFKKEGVEKLTLVEAPELKDSRKKFNSDYILTVMPHEPIDEQITIQQDTYSRGTQYDLDWTYYKVYYRKGRRVSTSQLIGELLKNHAIGQFFFVNYKEKEEHIRVRMKVPAMEVKSLIDQEFNRFVQSGRIKKFSEHKYQPEYSRYGGCELIENVHTLFMLDTTLSIYFSYTREYTTLSEVEKGIYMCMHTIMDMFDTYEQAMTFLTKLTPTKNKEIFKEFSSKRDKYVYVAKRSLNLYSKNIPFMKEKRQKYRDFVKHLDKFSEERKFYIVNSLLHMTMNRVLGIDREMEEEVYEFSKYIFHNLKYPLEMLGEYDDYL